MSLAHTDRDFRRQSVNDHTQVNFDAFENYDQTNSFPINDIESLLRNGNSTDALDRGLEEILCRKFPIDINIRSNVVNVLINCMCGVKSSEASKDLRGIFDFQFPNLCLFYIIL